MKLINSAFPERYRQRTIKLKQSTVMHDKYTEFQGAILYKGYTIEPVTTLFKICNIKRVTNVLTGDTVLKIGYSIDECKEYINKITNNN